MIDFEKLMEQDPAFKEYLQEAALAILLADRLTAHDILSTMFNFYQIGMTAEQVKQWVRNTQSYGSNNG